MILIMYFFTLMCSQSIYSSNSLGVQDIVIAQNLYQSVPQTVNYTVPFLVTQQVGKKQGQTKGVLGSAVATGGSSSQNIVASCDIEIQGSFVIGENNTLTIRVASLSNFVTNRPVTITARTITIYVGGSLYAGIVPNFTFIEDISSEEVSVDTSLCIRAVGAGTYFSMGRINEESVNPDSTLTIGGSFMLNGARLGDVFGLAQNITAVGDIIIKDNSGSALVFYEDLSGQVFVSAAVILSGVIESSTGSIIVENNINTHSAEAIKYGTGFVSGASTLIAARSIEFSNNQSNNQNAEILSGVFILDTGRNNPAELCTARVGSGIKVTIQNSQNQWANLQFLKAYTSSGVTPLPFSSFDITIGGTKYTNYASIPAQRVTLNSINRS